MRRLKLGALLLLFLTLGCNDDSDSISTKEKKAGYSDKNTKQREVLDDSKDD